MWVGYVLNQKMFCKNTFERNKGNTICLNLVRFLYVVVNLGVFCVCSLCPFSLKMSHLDSSDFFKLCSKSWMQVCSSGVMSKA